MPSNSAVHTAAKMELVGFVAPSEAQIAYPPWSQHVIFASAEVDHSLSFAVCPAHRSPRVRYLLFKHPSIATTISSSDL